MSFSFIAERQLVNQKENTTTRNLNRPNSNVPFKV